MTIKSDSRVSNADYPAAHEQPWSYGPSACNTAEVAQRYTTDSPRSSFHKVSVFIVIVGSAITGLQASPPVQIEITSSKSTSTRPHSPWQNTQHSVSEGLIFHLSKRSTRLGDRLRRYKEFCERSGLLNLRYSQFILSMRILNLLLPRPLGFLWNAKTGKIQIQFERTRDNTLALLEFRNGKISFADVDNEYEFSDEEEFQKEYLEIVDSNG